MTKNKNNKCASHWADSHHLEKGLGLADKAVFDNSDLNSDKITNYLIQFLAMSFKPEKLGYIWKRRNYTSHDYHDWKTWISSRVRQILQGRHPQQRLTLATSVLSTGESPSITSLPLAAYLNRRLRLKWRPSFVHGVCHTIATLHLLAILVH